MEGLVARLERGYALACTELELMRTIVSSPGAIGQEALRVIGRVEHGYALSSNELGALHTLAAQRATLEPHPSPPLPAGAVPHAIDSSEPLTAPDRDTPSLSRSANPVEPSHTSAPRPVPKLKPAPSAPACAASVSAAAGKTTSKTAGKTAGQAGKSATATAAAALSKPASQPTLSRSSPTPSTAPSTRVTRVAPAGASTCDRKEPSAEPPANQKPREGRKAGRKVSTKGARLALPGERVKLGSRDTSYALASMTT